MPSRLVKKLVLIVDSDLTYTNALVHALEERGYSTLVALSAEVATEKAKTLDLDLIILNEDLPDANGFDVCALLKNSKSTEHIPVMILNVDCKSYQRIKGYHLGADDCVGKYLDKEELLARIEGIWKRNNTAFRGQGEDRQEKVVQELARIIDNEMVVPHFQSIYYIKPFRLLGLEVLSRPPAGSLLTSADVLFKAAAKYDMYYQLEMLCWRKALDIVSVQTRNEHIFFNCSPYIVENSKFHAVKSIFEQSKISLDKVVLELTERSSISDHDLFHERLKEYRNHGFSFAIDDVGGGYASLESIVATKPEIVKIDAHIVRNLHNDPIKRSIIKFMIDFCKENDIISVAEGVETASEMEAVISLGIDAVQGYYLFRPTAELNLRQMRDVCVAFS